MAFLPLLLVAGAPGGAAPPNIILIFADDIGMTGFSCYGGQYKTPQIDALAQSGTRFEYCYSMALCGPSRGVLLTGRYPFRTGMLNNNTGASVKPQNEVCIAKALKQAGYATAVAGKWRQLEYLTTPDEAKAWGFDEFMVWYDKSKGERYWKPHYNHNGKVMEGVEQKYGPDLLHEFVVDFVTRHKDRPFFVYYPMPLVHGPILRTPDSAAGGAAARKDLFADNVAYMDKLVGKLAAELDKLGLREKTALIFTTDNGSVARETINGKPVDGTKGSMKEGGARVPLVVSWKGTTPAGAVVKDLVDFSDFFPTLAELAGAKAPEKIDGRSFAAQLKGQPAANPREWVYVQIGRDRYVRDAEWKLYGDGTLVGMKEAPHREIPAAEPDAAAADTARRRLQAALDGLK